MAPRRMPPNYLLSVRHHPNVLAKIAGFSGRNGIDHLRPFIRAGPDLKKAALSEEAMSKLSVSNRHDFAWWSDQVSWYNGVFRRMVKAKHTYALYIESLRLAFNVGEIDVALYILNDVKDNHPHAQLMFIMLSFCAGRDCLKDELELKRQFRFKDIELMGKEVMYHITGVNPKEADSYRATWHPTTHPECWDKHEWLGEVNGERCHDCIYWYLSIEICKMS